MSGRPAVARLFLEALRLDREPVEAVRERAVRALSIGVGGFVLFGGEADRVRELCGELRARADRPLWLAADLERGAGQQFRGATQLPPPLALAAHPAPVQATRRAAALTAREARELGLNWALAPVLDLDADARNPIVGTRSFGDRPETVAALGEAWVDACQEEGVAACAKHFPGHGRTVTDSHLELPRVEAGRRALEEDLRPFRAVADRVATVMTAHVAYPSLGVEGPATFSRTLLTDLLRAEWAFGGLVVTDAMIMAGFREASSGGEPSGSDGPSKAATAAEEAEAAARALAAGCDVLLYPDDLAAAVDGLAHRAERDPPLAARLRAAGDRSRSLLRRFGRPAALRGGERPEGGDVDPPATAAERREEALRLATGCLRAVGMPHGDGAEREGAERRPEAFEIRWISDDPDDSDASPPGLRLCEELRRLGWRAADPRPLGTPGASAAPAAGVRRLVVVRSTPKAWKGRADLAPGDVERVRGALRGSGDVAVVLGHPRLLDRLGVSGICAWAAEDVMERAVGRWLDERLRREGG